MAEVKKKNNKTTSTTSKVRSGNKKKVEVSNLSNDEILEQILNKKNKKGKGSIDTEKCLKKSEVSIKKENIKNKSSNLSELSNDELLEQILNKKKNKKKSSQSIKTFEKKEKIVNTDSDDVEIASDKKENVAELSSDELYDLIKSKKKSKKSSSIVNDSSKKEKIQVKEVNKIDKIETTDNVEKIVEPENEKVSNTTSEIVVDKTVLKKVKTEKDNKKDKKDIDELTNFTNRLTLDDIRIAIDESEKSKKEVKEKKSKFNKKSLYEKLEYVFVSLLIFFSFFMIGYTIVGYFKMNKEQTTLNNRTDFNDTVNIIDSAELRKELYEDCMRRPFSELERTEEVKRAEEELSDYLKNKYNVSIAYEDLTIGYSYAYNVDAVYYGASTIKALDALYIYTKAAQGELNLDDTMVYTSEYKWGSSREMSKYKYGDKVSLRNLVKFAITVSDNTAHQMLVSYIGRENLKAFGNSLGAKNTLLGSADNFGNTTALDTMIYMKAINSFINSNVELGAELKSYFVQADQNGLGFPELGIEAAHKYGEYDYFYHDIGIVYDKNPYVITIMTLEGNKNFVDIIKDINSRVYKLHNLYYSNKDSLCQLEIYAE